MHKWGRQALAYKIMEVFRRCKSALYAASGHNLQSIRRCVDRMHKPAFSSLGVLYFCLGYALTSMGGRQDHKENAER